MIIYQYDKSIQKQQDLIHNTNKTIEKLEIQNNTFKKQQIQKYNSVTYFPTETYHTNEILVFLGGDYFAECSSQHAAQILQRRLEFQKRNLERMEKEREAVINRYKKVQNEQNTKLLEDGTLEITEPIQDDYSQNNQKQLNKSKDSQIKAKNLITSFKAQNEDEEEQYKKSEIGQFFDNIRKGNISGIKNEDKSDKNKNQQNPQQSVQPSQSSKIQKQSSNSGEKKQVHFQDDKNEKNKQKKELNKKQKSQQNSNIFDIVKPENYNFGNQDYQNESEQSDEDGIVNEDIIIHIKTIHKPQKESKKEPEIIEQPPKKISKFKLQKMQEKEEN